MPTRMLVVDEDLMVALRTRRLDDLVQRYRGVVSALGDLTRDATSVELSFLHPGAPFRELSLIVSRSLIDGYARYHDGSYHNVYRPLPEARTASSARYYLLSLQRVIHELDSAAHRYPFSMALRGFVASPPTFIDVVE
jgi:hypothetical protein